MKIKKITLYVAISTIILVISKIIGMIVSSNTYDYETIWMVNGIINILNLINYVLLATFFLILYKNQK